MKRNNIIAIAMALVAVLAIATILLVMVKTPGDVAPSTTGDVKTTIVWPEWPEPRTETKHVEMPVKVREENRLLLVDTSYSQQGTVVVNPANYDSVVTFSDNLGQGIGGSWIAKNIAITLDMGIRELGIMSDLESWPDVEADRDWLDGKHYLDREVYVYLPQQAIEEDIAWYREKFFEVLDEESSTLVFVYTDGHKDVVFDNYQTSPTAVETDVEIKVIAEGVIPDINTVDNRTWEPGNYVPPHVVRNIVIASICAIAGLIEVILALLLWKRWNDDPEWVSRAVSTGNVALDGSGSVAAVYSEMIGYLKRRQKSIRSIWRFADNVEKLTLQEARNCKAGGQTHGWKCLQKMQEEGIQDITILSDLGFNDTEISGLHFRKIVFLVPSNHNSEMLNKLKEIAEENEVIFL